MKTKLFLGILFMSIIGISTVFGQNHRGNRHFVGVNQAFYQSYQYQIDQAFYQHFLTRGERQTLIKDLNRLYARESAMVSDHFVSLKERNRMNRDLANFERKFATLVHNGNRRYAHSPRGNSCEHNGYHSHDDYAYNDSHNHGRGNNGGSRNHR